VLFIEAISKAKSQTSGKHLLAKSKTHSPIVNKDSVDLSLAAHQVKEIHLESQIKEPLTAASSIFANLIEHILRHITQNELHLHSPEELNLEDKDWQLHLQVPPTDTDKSKKVAGYVTPETYRRPAKQLIFHIPVKPSYGPETEMTLLMSSHRGSPDTPELFNQLPKENWLPPLQTPYLPEIINQQATHHHIFLDQDGEADQLAPLYALVKQSRLAEESTLPQEIYGLRIWKAKNNTLEPILLGDKKIGLLFVDHHTPLDSQAVNAEEKTRQENQLSIKA